MDHRHHQSTSPIPGVMADGHLHHWEPEDLSGIKSLNLRQQAQEHLRWSSLTDEIMPFRSQTPLLGVSGGAIELMQHHVLFYESASSSDRYVSESCTHCQSLHSAPQRESSFSHEEFYPHLLRVFFQTVSGSDMEVQAKHHRAHSQAVTLRRVNDSVTASRWLGSKGIKLIAFKLIRTIRIKPHGQVCGDQLQVISIKEAQQSTSSSFFEIQNSQVLKESATGAGQPHCNQVWPRESSAPAQLLKSFKVRQCLILPVSLVSPLQGDSLLSCRCHRQNFSFGI